MSILATLCLRICRLLTWRKNRRYGLIGRNGIGKSTLLRAMALREVAVPQHITILYVQQEVIGDDTLAIESVLQADVHRTRLMQEEATLNATLQSMEDAETTNPTVVGTEDSMEAKRKVRKRDEATARLGEVQKSLVEIDADSGPSRAAELLAGLGFDAADQVRRILPFSFRVNGIVLTVGETLAPSYPIVLRRMEDEVVPCSR